MSYGNHSEKYARVATYFFIDKYDYSSERWKKPEIIDDPFYTPEDHCHVLEYASRFRPSFLDPYAPLSYLFTSKECAFCQADFYDRTLKEILYYIIKCGNDSEIVHRSLILKWENNVDAWGNAIGNNIKGE